jgi:4'-phosphopantetheinyl transferase EntD
MHGAGSPADLWPAEAACLVSAVPKRIMEFAAGRACARRALQELGIDDFVLLPAEDRQPLWPRSIVGSITHTTGYCAAVVARRESFAGIGIDSEEVSSVARDLWPTICTPEETGWCASLPGSQQPAAAALLFSAKEAFYKGQYPGTREWLNFHDLCIEPAAWGAPQGQFTVRATRRIAAQDLGHWPLTGQFRFHDAWVTAAVAFQQLQ